MRKFICTVCGYVHEGDTVPEICPQCKASFSKFKPEKVVIGGIKWADEHRIGSAKGIDEEIVDGLRQNFKSECTEIGVYLAMSRQADREGYPEIAATMEKIAKEEAGHAAKFAELLGEGLTSDTKKNLMAVIKAEGTSCEEKKKLAERAKEQGLDAIHDTVHEMCKDEARHGMAFYGLLNRLFNKTEE